jgi:serine/threonine protein kinase
MSSIYLALDRASETLCVLKTAGAVDLSDHRGQSDARMCLEREALILRDLHHPGIIELLGWYPEEQAPFMALTYVPGPSLEQRLAHGPLPLGEALRHATGIAQAIRYLASQRHPITHCDIKPSNLIAPPGGPAILLDFGSAVTQTIANTTRRLDHYGTPGYAAPEQYQHQASPASDIYALAATLYHLVTGDDPTTHPLAFPALWRLPAELQEILSAALERNPASRPTPDLFAVQLQRAAQRYG